MGPEVVLQGHLRSERLRADLADVVGFAIAAVQLVLLVLGLVVAVHRIFVVGLAVYVL